MRKIGFTGGARVSELGPASDVVLFFECIKTYVERANPETDWCLLTDRLYRRYLRREELKPAMELMRLVREIFAKQPTKTSVEWDAEMLSNPQRTSLNPDRQSLASVFSEYFDSFEAVCGSAESFAETFNIYQPVRIAISDLPGLARDKNKPLAEYDALEGKPFWLQ
ncbi:hypothetical protein R69746_08071 [Paraburkholderia aspalathi]|uniref:hypothetical protein n=1 Tax=Paraburkholderia aspalathi TaxID=1324617 RepID=UPI00190A8A6E|nr:hypothetical protein [Paraburkholderia aspalathi]MBK3844031.1 hypothetical protein [Paraburkholderia aspalathi]CAE6865569.1 hypothetical protein R69746_08071 [Paraburkholderia aspalathi]CAE6874547.1 hypothetical protein R75465_08518 [Paraburkholderia aspalathi]